MTSDSIPSSVSSHSASGANNQTFGDPSLMDGGSSAGGAILKRLSESRNRLIDRNLRNRLISTPLGSSRSKSVRVFGESSDQVFSTLVGKKSSMTFLPVDESQQTESDDEKDPFHTALSYDNLQSNDESRQSDTALQTKLNNSSLSKKLLSIYYESRDYEEEQGVNVLYLACGFLKWYEDTNSSIERYAPLVLIPVNLIRQTGKGEGFLLKAREDEFLTNISLKVWLQEQFNIELPEIPEDGEWDPASYCLQVADAIKFQQRWEVLKDEILLGFFSFSKFLLWRDLDPDTWPKGISLAEHPIIQKLLGCSKERKERDPPLLPPEDSLDNHFSPRDLVYVLDADPSQTEAIQTALAGRDMVIQGPPGTGKSQTITNLIAAAVAGGKSVLFVAEKMAALEVVHTRLVKAGISEICLELHSRKANKKSVHEQLKVSIDPAPELTPPMQKVDRLKELQDFLNSHASRVNTPLSPWGFTPYELLGELCLTDLEDARPLDSQVPGADSYTKESLEQFLYELKDLCERLRSSGFPIKNAWSECGFAVLTPLATQRISSTISTTVEYLLSAREDLGALNLAFGDQIGSFHEKNISELVSIMELAQIARSFPSACPVDLASSLDLYNHRVRVKTVLANLIELQKDQQFIDSSFDKVWRSIDIQNLRHRYKTNGGSFFSIFNGNYRQANREVSAVLRAGLPKAYNERVALLDRLINFADAEITANSLEDDLKNNLGRWWQGVLTNAEPLEKLVSWYDSTSKLGSIEYQFVTSIAQDEALLRAADSLRLTLAKVLANLSILRTSLVLSDKALVEDSFSTLERRLTAYLQAIDQINYWPPTRDKLSDLLGQIGDELYTKIWNCKISIEEIIPVVKVSIYEAIWAKYAEARPELREIDAHRLNASLDEFRRLDVLRSKIAAAQIKHAYVKSVPVGNSGDMGVIRQELIKKSRHKSLRKLISEAGSAIQKLKPVFLMSPLSVAQYLQPGRLMFDLIVIDEASQIRPEDAIGAIARGKQVVVVGDQQQLPPTNFFNRLISEDEEILDDEDDFAVSDLESILSLSDIALSNQKMLTWHYRSLHPGLIAVSNRNFYQNQLKLPPSTIRNSFAEGMGVSLVKSPSNSYERGGSRGGTNTAEAELIAKDVIAFARSNPEKSLGVAAFSVKQRDLIRELVEIQLTKNSYVKEFFSEARPEPFFVKNLESIQGDERDVIFISVGYGRSADGVLRKSFGPLALAGGERRLNVLISRAKERVTVYSSITADDFKSEPGKVGLNAFREFLQYAEKGFFEVSTETERTFDSDFEESVAVFLQNRGHQVVPQVGMAGFFIDLGVVHPSKPSSYLCGIECDGATYHSSRSARERDRLRQQILESRGWRIYRIWSTDWFYRRANQEKRLLDALEEMLNGDKPLASTNLSYPTEDDLGSHELDIEDSDSSGREEISSRPSMVAVPYEECNFKQGIDGEIHALPRQKIDFAVTRIVSAEGPIHEQEVGRRLARVFGKQKAGAIIQDTARAALNRIGAQQSDQFWMFPDQQVRIRVRKGVVTETSLLKAEMLPPIEIQEAAFRIIGASVRISDAELVIGVSRMFGFDRCGPDLSKVIRDALNNAVAISFDRDPEGFYSLNCRS